MAKMHGKLEVPHELANTPVLRTECLIRHWQEPTAVFTLAEFDTIVKLYRAHEAAYIAAHPEAHEEFPVNPGFAIITRDMDTEPAEVPKWATLAQWLTPESVAGSCPALVVEIATRALQNKLGKP